MGTRGVPAEIIELLQDTRERYGPAAVLIQVRLLHRTIHSGSIMTAAVRVAGFSTSQGRRYLTYQVDTGVVFNSRTTGRSERVNRLWADVVVPTLQHVENYDVPGDGIEVDLGCSHRSYRDQQELEQTVSADPGRPERISFHLLKSDILEFKHALIADGELYARSQPRVDGVPLPRGAAGPATR